MNEMNENKSINSDRYEEFLESIPNIQSRRVYKSYSVFGEYDYTNCSIEIVKNVIRSVHPKSTKSITTACNVLKKYAKFLGDMQLVGTIDSIDRKELWNEIKSDDIKKFISHSYYEEICYELGKEEYNPFYYQTLFMAIYEGVYSSDLSVLKNLRASDIKKNKVLLRPDNGEEYFLKVSKKLIVKLIELSEEEYWRQANAFNENGYIEMPLYKHYPDACFKTVRRGTGKVNHTASYLLRFRKIATDYVDRPLKPYDLFISGIAYRIAKKLKANKITLQKAFEPENRDHNIRNIFENELLRCHYPNEVKNFRELVENYIDVFAEE